MIDLNKCEGWQKRDKDGVVMPWYTHPALDEIEKWDKRGFTVFEYGCGQSTIWWRKYCQNVCGVESNRDWAEVVEVHFAIEKSRYIDKIFHYESGFDIVVVDGECRDECVKAGIKNIRQGGKLIIDNWAQPSVWMPTEETISLVTQLPHTIYKQPGHPDWQTLIATK